MIAGAIVGSRQEIAFNSRADIWGLRAYRRYLRTLNIFLSVLTSAVQIVVRRLISPSTRWWRDSVELSTSTKGSCDD